MPITITNTILTGKLIKYDLKLERMARNYENMAGVLVSSFVQLKTDAKYSFNTLAFPTSFSSTIMWILELGRVRISLECNG